MELCNTLLMSLLDIDNFYTLLMSISSGYATQNGKDKQYKQ